ncbi:MAG: lamin tail domain-containing protein [Candidatus Stygibacter australis]|nr:lamin tail domain-containing protein [Candidatus Stygibacter australis]
MLLRCVLTVIFLNAINVLFCQVVINELYYDHPGGDDGEEWVELYNTSSEAINLEYWRIEKGGSEFETVLFLPFIIIEGNGYLLIGESNVPGADIYAELVFQNGGSTTDGVRLVSGFGPWTDTVLYDSPNSNELIDDTGFAGVSFAPDVTAGHSLGRIPNGYDSNQGSDWQECENLSPGTANIISIDLEISEAELTLIDGNICLYTVVHNLSTGGVDNSVGSLDIYFNNQPFESLPINEISGNESLEYSYELGESVAGYSQTELIINSIYDNNLENNISGCSILIEMSPLWYNELMIKPLGNDCEWVEIIVDNYVDNFVDNLYIRDAVGNTGSFAAADLGEGFLVICDEPESLIANYGLTASQVIESEQLPGMNNEGDILYLEDEWGTLLDMVEYGALAGNEEGISWERINPLSDDSDWGHCISESGQTAGYANSLMQGMIDLALDLKGVNLQEEYLEHHLLVTSAGIEQVDDAELVISWQVFSGGNYGSYSENIIIDSDSLEIVINTELPGSGFYEYTYQLEVEGDTDLSNNVVVNYFNQGSLGWVINEIMYHPKAGEPEWLELKRNVGYGMADNLWVIVDDDSCEIAAAGEYVIVTGSESDVEEMWGLYGEDLEISEGLKRLTDSGCEIGIKDMYGNIIELFSYDPDWNQSIQGVSIERVNPLLPASEDNWSRSVSECTPGEANSIYTELPVTGSKLTITPEVFCPRDGEHTVISYQNSENLNLVRIAIYDLKGRKICKLVDHEYQGANGYYIWDGRNEAGKIVKMGIYIILFETSAAGNIKVEKKTVVVKR